MKKLVALLCLVVASLALCSCGKKDTKETTEAKVKVGLIALHDEDSTYDKNFIDAFYAACEAKGVQGVVRTNVPENVACYDAALDLVDEGCVYVFADSFSHESYLLQAAQENPTVEFCHATGTGAHTANQANFHNAFAAIYEGRYLAGVAAGLKLQAMMEADPTLVPTLGYIGAYTYAEVISGYTSWFLGVQSIVPTATMKVTFTGSWYDETLEKNAAKALIETEHCVLISQHADSWGAPKECEKQGVPNVSYNGSTGSQCPNTFIVSSRINWQPYFEYCFDAVLNGTEIKTDYVGTLANGSVELTALGNAAVDGTQDKLDEVTEALKNGTLKVFDLSKFTVGGNPIADTYKADVNDDADRTPDTVVIKTTDAGVKYFAESNEAWRSAPYFNISAIDGITLLNVNFGD